MMLDDATITHRTATALPPPFLRSFVPFLPRLLLPEDIVRDRYRCSLRTAGGQFNSFVEISTDFSTDFSTELV